jgi:hypothetical protein
VTVAEALPIVERELVERMAHTPPYSGADGTYALEAAR